MYLIERSGKFIGENLHLLLAASSSVGRLAAIFAHCTVHVYTGGGP